MHIETLQQRDFDSFLFMAEEENWICERQEFSFLLNSYPQGAFVLRGCNGEPLAFVTSIAYQKSGWIGNLIVAKDQRRKGIGTLLMNRCLDTLASSGVRTVWLTASPSGAPLYERLGFKAIDRILRLRMAGSLKSSIIKVPSGADIIELFRCDRYGWGDDRSLLCSEAIRNGSLVGVPGGAMVIRKMGSGIFIGPWMADSPESAGELLGSAMEERLETGSTIADVPFGNSHARRLLEKNGFVHCSETVLMYLGDVPEYRPAAVFALASPGSVG